MCNSCVVKRLIDDITYKYQFVDQNISDILNSYHCDQSCQIVQSNKCTQVPDYVCDDCKNYFCVLHIDTRQLSSLCRECSNTRVTKIFKLKKLQKKSIKTITSYKFHP